MFEETLLPSQKGDVLELDELWSFVQKKTQECWLWLALCRRTRQIVAYTVGDRSEEGAKSLREHLPSDYRRCATRSDFWLAYESAFPHRTHRFCGKEEGETNHAERFAQVRQRDQGGGRERVFQIGGPLEEPGSLTGCLQRSQRPDCRLESVL